MRLLHTSDWHLGKRLDLFSRIEEQKQVLDEIIHIADTYKVDAVIIAGDLFDSFNPSTEAQELFYSALKRMSSNGSRPVLAIAGNHDSADAIQAPDPLARVHGIVLLGYITTRVTTVTTDSGVTISSPVPGGLRIEWDPEIAGAPRSRLNVLATPYANERRIQHVMKKLALSPLDTVPRSDSDFIQDLGELWASTAEGLFRPGDVNIFAGHLYAHDAAAGGIQSKAKEQLEFELEGYMERHVEGHEFQGPDMGGPLSGMPPEPEDEKPILYKGGLPPIPVSALPRLTQYAALGHLHRGHCVSTLPIPAAYCGSPLAYSRSESGQEKFVNLVDIEPEEEAKIQQVPLHGGLEILRPVCESIEEAVQWLSKHPQAYVELTLKLDTYLSSEDRRRLYGAHERILSIIPEIEGAELQETGKIADVNQSIDTLFSEYYASEHQGSLPSKEILELFKEVLSISEDYS